MDMSATLTSDGARGVDLSQIWVAFDKFMQGLAETGKELAENSKNLAETGKRIDAIAVRQAETSEQMRKTDEQIRKTDIRIDKLAKNVGGLGNSIGGIIETLIAANVWEKFVGYPYNLKRSYRRIKIYDENNTELSDIDILLVDTQYAMAIEVKREPDREDIDHHLYQMELIRKYPPLEMKVDKLLGAIAGGAVSADVRDYAHQNGFFVLELTGEQVELVKPVKVFTAKEW